MNFLVDVAAVGRKRAHWQACAQFLSTIRSARAKLSQADRKAMKAGEDFSARLCFERDVTAKLDGKSCWRCPSPTLCSGSAQAAMTSGMGVKRIELVFQ